MTFQDAVRSCLTQKYADFAGRARRSEFWWFWVFSALVSGAAQIIDRSAGASNFLGGLVGLALLLPSLGVAVRRLHDIGRSGWSLLFGLIPLAGAIILIVWWAKEGEPGANAYGPSPKGGVAGNEPASV